MTENQKCTTCLSNRAPLSCGLCHCPICKNCTEFLPEGSFALMDKMPEEFANSRFCHSCFRDKVQSALQNYKETLERAKAVFILGRVRRKPVPIIRQSHKPIVVEGCTDREETYLRLGFLAAQQGFNAVIRADVACTKIRNGGYQKMLWRGEGIAAEVDGPRIEFQSEN